MGETGEPGKKEYFGIQYVAGSDGIIRPEVVPQIMKNDFGHLYDERLARLFSGNLERLMMGEITPVALYRLQQDMTEIELGARSGLGRRAVRKHETLSGFLKATVGELASYAKVFGIPLSAMFCVFDARASGAVEMVDTGQGLVSVVRPAGDKR